MDYHSLVELVLGSVVPIAVWLLSSKDRQQERQLDDMNAKVVDLYSKHEVDVAELSSLKTKVAEKHPQREEVRDMMTDMKLYLDSRFSSIEEGIRSLRQNK